MPNSNKNENGCSRCGRCCMSAEIRLPGIGIHDGSGFAQWLSLHRCDAREQDGPDGKSLALRIPLVCVKLGETPDGRFFCMSYDSRPQICRDYLCKRAKGKENG